MGMHRQYVPVDPTKGGLASAIILGMAMIGSVAILVASVFLGVKLASIAGDEPPPPPAPIPPPPINITITSKIQMALLFLDAQKAGRLPSTYPITWRNDSGLWDGQDQNRNLSGGYYIGGSNVKYHFPMAWTVTMLSWALLEYESVFRMVNMHNEMAQLIEWGVQYILETRYEDIIFAQVGSPDIDDVCWIRPEDMRPAQRPTQFPCDVTHPCSDLAGEYAAALAAASLTNRIGNPAYADYLLSQSKEIFLFADQYRGKYSDWVESAQAKYNSTGYTDELMWAASWLYFASGEQQYLEYVIGPNSYIFETNQWGPDTKWFDWDNKSPGVQVLMSRLLLLGYGMNNENQVPQFLQTYLNAAKLYVCQHTPFWPHANLTQNGSLIYISEDHPMQYSVNAAFLSTLMSDYLRVSLTSNTSTHYLDCDATVDDVLEFSAQQVRYILGENPAGMSYMVGYGENYPTRVHHRGASIPSPAVDPTRYDCSSGKQFYKSKNPNPNVLVGAIVGGPARDDTYANDRTIPEQSEPLIYINAVFAGLLAGLGAPIRPGNSLTRMWAMLPSAAKYAATIEEKIPRPWPTPPHPPIPPPPWSPPQMPKKFRHPPAKEVHYMPDDNTYEQPRVMPSPPLFLKGKGKWKVPVAAKGKGKGEGGKQKQQPGKVNGKGVKQQPGVKNPAVKIPAVKIPAVKIPAVKNPAVKNPVVKNPVVKNPVVKNPVVKNPVVKNPVVKNPVVKNPVVKNPVVKNPVVKNPVVKNPVVENPVVKNPVVENPVVKNPGAVKEPVIEHPGAKNPAVNPAQNKPAVQQQPVVKDPVGGVEQQPAVEIQPAKGGKQAVKEKEAANPGDKKAAAAGAAEEKAAHAVAAEKKAVHAGNR